MSLLGDFFEGVSSFCSSIVSGIESVCSAIGGALFSGVGGVAAVASALIPGVGLPEIVLAVKVISVIVSSVAEILGLTTKEEKPEQIGMAAEEADLKPADFDSVSEYIDYLRNEMKTMDLDRRVEGLSDEARVKYQAIGSAILIKGIEEKYSGLEIPADFWQTAAKLDLKGEEVKTYMDTFKESGIGSMKDMSDYLKGNNTKADIHSVSDTMMQSLSKVYPEMSEKELQQKLSDMEGKMQE